MRSRLLSFCHTDAGRAESRRPKQRYDCTVRALASVMAWPYDQAYDLAAAAGRKSGKPFRLAKTYLPQKTLPFTTICHSFPAKAGEPRMTLGRFCAEHPDRRFIVKMAKHVVAVIDGIAYDDEALDENRCVYRAWEFS